MPLPSRSLACLTLVGALMMVGPAGSERQAQMASAVQTAPVDTASVGMVPVKTAPVATVPVKKVKTVAVSAAPQKAAAGAPASVEPANPVPAAPLEPVASAPAAPASHPIVEPMQQRWADAIAAAPAKVAGEAQTSGAINEERFSALAMLPVIAEPTVAAEAEATAAEPGRKTRMAASANLRARPANGGKRLTTLAAGTPIALLGCGQGWCEVAAGGQRGFVAERFLKGKAAVGSRKAAASPRKATRKRKPQKAAAQPEPAKELPGVFPEPVIPAPSER